MRPSFTDLQNQPVTSDRSATSPATAPRSLPYTTAEGIRVKPRFTVADLADDDNNPVDHLRYGAGIPPYLRGPYASMYVRQPWTIRQYAGFSTAEASNAFYRRNLAAGQKGLSVAFDLATHRATTPTIRAWLAT